MKPRHIGLAILVNVVFAVNVMAGKIGVDHFPALFFTALRFAVVALAVAAFMRLQPGRMGQLVRLAMVIGVFHFAFMFIGLKLASGISSVAIGAQLYIPFATLLAAVFLKERVGLWRLAGLVLAFSGVMFITFDPSVFDNLVSLAFVVLGALAMGVGVIMIRRSHAVDVVNLQGWIAVISVPQLLILSFILEDGQIEALRTADGMVIGALAFTALIGTLVGHGGWYHLLRRYPVGLVTPFLLLAPVFAVIGGVLFMGDLFGWAMVIGGAITLAGVGIIIVREGAAAARPAPAPGRG